MMMTSSMAGPRWRPRRRLDGRLRLWRTRTRRGRRDEPNGTHPRTKRRTTTAGDDDGGGGATRMELGRRRRRGGARGGGAMRHGRPRERGQTKEED
uniref:Uncharacterized protein n=1 Tax=Oryza sativa subsp. japonica TaxID=39947 RepID=Q6ZLN1_ORYSJ|nr:hypothetical protein [Oryza sativa Japonica Group]BAD31958.1 hypothetical protein [Oryza sativa Japonica Group]